MKIRLLAVRERSLLRALLLSLGFPEPELRAAAHPSHLRFQGAELALSKRRGRAAAVVVLSCGECCGYHTSRGLRSVADLATALPRACRRKAA